jgi:hypothetical protein
MGKLQKWNLIKEKKYAKIRWGLLLYKAAYPILEANGKTRRFEPKKFETARICERNGHKDEQHG